MTRKSNKKKQPTIEETITNESKNNNSDSNSRNEKHPLSNGKQQKPDYSPNKQQNPKDIPDSKHSSLKHQSLSTSLATPKHKHKITEAEFIANENLEQESLQSSIAFFTRHSIRDVKRRKFHFGLAFCSVFIVVLAALVINTVVEKGPIIFLRLAEGTNGEIDAHVVPFGSYYKDSEDQSSALFINYTRVVELFGQDKFNLSPRKIYHGSAQLYGPNINRVDESIFGQRSGKNSPQDFNEWKKSFTYGVNLPSREDVYTKNYLHTQQLKLVLFDTLQDRKIGQGRDWSHDPIGLGECMIPQKRQGEFNDAHIAIMKFSVTHMLNDIIDRFNRENPTSKHVHANHQMLMVTIPCKIKYVSGLEAKQPDDRSQMFMEKGKLLELLSHYLPDSLNNNEDFKRYLRIKSSTLINDYADSLVVTMPHPRTSHYENPNIQIIRGKVAAYMTELENSLGFFPIHIYSPLLKDLTTFTMGILFMGLIFDLIVILLMVISVLLIYSLLMINIETKSFEIGVQRMVGLSKTGLIAMVLIQSFLFVVPSIICGFIVSVPCLQIFAQVLKEFLKIEADGWPSSPAIIQALAVGIFIPLISSIIPINAALKKNLNDALDYQRSKTQAVYMEVLTKDKRGLSNLTLFGVISCTYGISIYYLLPLGLLSFNLSLILQVFILILFGILLAMSLLALNSQRLIEIAFTYMFLFFEQSSIKIMVLKNLMAHRDRNRLTTIIYSLALGFIIFLIVSYKVQLETLRLHELRFRAGYLQIQIEDPLHPLNPRTLEPVIRANAHLIEEFSWIPCELNRIQELKIQKAQISDFAKLSQHEIGIYGVLPNLFKATHQELLDIHYKDPESALNMVEQLYTPRGSQSAGMGHIVTKRTFVDPEDYTQTLIIEMFSKYKNLLYQIRPLFTMNMSPGFTMVDRDLSVFNKNTILMSLPMYAYLAKSRINEIPMERLILKLKDHKNPEHIAAVKHAFKDILEAKGPKEHQIRDLREDQASLNDVELILQIIFSAVIPLTMFLCFFSLSASMSANLFEQCKEIATLRSIGFVGKSIIKVYVYEAFILVTSSSLLGILIGTFVGWIMTLQQGMFLQLPISFIFPTMQLLQIFTFSIICAVLSTYGPTKSLMSKSIPSINRAG